MNRDQTTLPAEPATASFLRPAYRVGADGDVFTVDVRLPGVDRQGVEIHLHEDVLTLQARRTQSVPATWKTLSRESADGDYRLSLRLNVEINQDQIEAKVEDGILHLRLPKAEALKPRQIAIE